jgi:hypothetical protein
MKKPNPPSPERRGFFLIRQGDIRALETNVIKEEKDEEEGDFLSDSVSGFLYFFAFCSGSTGESGEAVTKK